MKTRVTRHWLGTVAPYYYLVERYGPVSPAELERIGCGANQVESFKRNEWRIVTQLVDKDEAVKCALALSALPVEQFDTATPGVIVEFENGVLRGSTKED